MLQWPTPAKRLHWSERSTAPLSQSEEEAEGAKVDSLVSASALSTAAPCAALFGSSLLFCSEFAAQACTTATVSCLSKARLLSNAGLAEGELHTFTK